MYALLNRFVLFCFVLFCFVLFSLTVTVDGAMLASRDFGFMLVQALSTMSLQIFLLCTWCKNISDIYATFTLRLGSYAIFALLRTFLGFGRLGKALKKGGIIEDERINGIGAIAS